MGSRASGGRGRYGARRTCDSRTSSWDSTADAVRSWTSGSGSRPTGARRRRVLWSSAGSSDERGERRPETSSSSDHALLVVRLVLSADGDPFRGVSQHGGGAAEGGRDAPSACTCCDTRCRRSEPAAGGPGDGDQPQHRAALPEAPERCGSSRGGSRSSNVQSTRCWRSGRRRSRTDGDEAAPPAARRRLRGRRDLVRDYLRDRPARRGLRAAGAPPGRRRRSFFEVTVRAPQGLFLMRLMYSGRDFVRLRARTRSPSSTCGRSPTSAGCPRASVAAAVRVPPAPATERFEALVISASPASRGPARAIRAGSTRQGRAAAAPPPMRRLAGSTCGGGGPPRRAAGVGALRRGAAAAAGPGVGSRRGGSAGLGEPQCAPPRGPARCRGWAGLGRRR